MLEDRLKVEREKLEKIEAPKDMEASLLSALDGAKLAKKRPNFKIASILLIVFLLMGHNSNNIAAVIKNREVLKESRLLNYKDLSRGNILDLMDSGYFQEINTGLDLGGGENLTIDGILVSENAINLFVSGSYENPPLVKIKNAGLVRMHYSSETVKKDGRSYTNYFVDLGIDKPRLDLEFINDLGDVFTQEVMVDMDRLVKNIELIGIKKNFYIDGEKYRLDHMVINPSEIIVRGYYENIFDLVVRHYTGGKKKEEIDLKLEINGRVYGATSSSFTTNLGGSSFEFRFGDFEKSLKDSRLLVLTRSGEKLGEVKIK